MTTIDPTTLDPATPDLDGLRRQLLGRFERFRQRVRTHLVLEGAARVAAVAVGLVLLSFVVDRVFRLGVGSRIVLLLLAIGFLAWEAWRHILRPLRLPMDAVDLATAIDRRDAGLPLKGPSAGENAKGVRHGPAPLASRVAAVLQLPDLLRGDRPPSAPMVR